MFRIESYITPILLSYIDKYVTDFNPSDAQVSLWGGGVTLHNLVLKAAVLQQEVALPFKVFSGRIHELLIQVPWTKIVSEPITVTIDTIECILGDKISASVDEGLTLQPSRRGSQLVDAPPGYMQALVRRIIANISIRVHHLIIKYVHHDIVLSLNVKHLSIDSAGTKWEPTFSDIDQKMPAIRKLAILDDLTICLDRSDSDGKIRFYNEPLLYRCRIEIRVLARLMSVQPGRTGSISVQLRSSKLAWGISSSQLILLLRTLDARDGDKESSTEPSPKITPVNESTSHRTPSADVDRPQPPDSWSKWAWSWLPSWINHHQDEVEETSMSGSSTPIYINTYFDEVSIVFKVMETEGGSRKRTRSILEFSTCLALKCYVCTPTVLRIKAGARAVILKSQGECVCGHMNINAAAEEPTIYLSEKQTEKKSDVWKWPDEDYVESTIVADVKCKDPGSKCSINSEETNVGSSSKAWSTHNNKEPKVDFDNFWQLMEPLIYIEYTHEKYPLSKYTSSMDNPPSEVQSSSGQEEWELNVHLQSMQLRLSIGLLHRISALRRILIECQTPVQENPLPTLTMEECEALHVNMPQRRINIRLQDFRLRMHPWDHSMTEKPQKTPLILNIDISQAVISILGPLYLHRVSLEACATKSESNLLQVTRLHVSALFESIEATICSLTNAEPKPCARTDLRLDTYILLNRQMFRRKETVVLGYSVKMRDANMCGSAARLWAAWQIPISLFNEKISLVLRHTTLAKDALEDEDSMTLDVTLEELTMRGYFTAVNTTHILTLQSARATVFHLPDNAIEPEQAWIFSAPEVQCTTPYLRAAVQWCFETCSTSLEYIGAWTEPAAFCVDPVFIAWLAYKPQTIQITDFHPKASLSKAISSTQFLAGRPYVQTNKLKDDNNILKGNGLMKLYERFQHNMLITVELGLMLVYVTTSTASVSDCSTIRLSMERNVALSQQRVLVLSVGRWSMHSNALTKHLWQDIRHDGPTFITDQNVAIESFPWKIQFADISCYTMETQEPRSGWPKDRPTGLKSQLRTTHTIHPRTILELVTASLSLSLVTKSLHYRTYLRKPDYKKQSEPDKKEQMMKYFISGANFKPTTLKEFVRGPERRTKTPGDTTQIDEPDKTFDSKTDQEITTGPVVSIGINLNADTPPVTVRLDQDQVQMIVATIHCLTHLLILLQRVPFSKPKTQEQFISQSPGANKFSSGPPSENDEPEVDSIESQSDLIPIFQAHPGLEREPNITTFLWFKWDICRATMIISTDQVKLAFDVENIVSSIELQEHYNQLKVKIATASVRYFKRTASNEWTPGVFGGRVIGARKSNADNENMNFLATTITQARISNLPTSWKEELHPKFFEQPDGVDSMWEIYAMVAPIEVLLQPIIFDKIISIAYELTPRSICFLRTEVEWQSTWQWPFCYINAGGLRLLVTCEYQDKCMETDDTFTISCDRITVNPHPENPMCRRLVKTSGETASQPGGPGFDGRQYELLVNNVAISTTSFAQLICGDESNPNLLNVGGQLHSHNLSRPDISEDSTCVISSLDISCVMAPALFVEDVLTCGPGIELNFLSNCAIELNIDQLMLIRQIHSEIGSAFRKSTHSHFNKNMTNLCPYAAMFTKIDKDGLLYTNGELGDSEDDSEWDTRSTLKTNWYPPCHTPPTETKKTTSVAFSEFEADPKEYLEMFITMGTIELSLYTVDDNNPEIMVLRPKGDTSSETGEIKPSCSTKMNDNLQLLHVMFQQPNLYFTRSKTQKTYQVSLFNAWVSFDAAEHEECWRSVFMCTAQGTVDPVSGIPPALATLKISMPIIQSLNVDNKNANKVPGSIHLEIERPVLFEVCVDRLKRLRAILELIQRKLYLQSTTSLEFQSKLPLFYVLRRFMVKNSIETATVQTSQMGVNGYDGSAGWDSASLQVAWDTTPDRMVVRSLLSAALVSAGTPHDARHTVLQPLPLGVEASATWEAWRLAEGGQMSREPNINLRIDFDRMVIDVRPDDLSALKRILQALKVISGSIHSPSVHSTNTGSMFAHDSTSIMSSTNVQAHLFDNTMYTSSIDHYYRDDLRSGAFNVVRGGQLPMAHEVALYGDAVSWRYPHPRAITRLTAFPLPEQDKEVECILEVYNEMLKQWEPHTYFNLPVYEPKEIQLYEPPPDAIFATTWRFRVCSDTKNKNTYEFSMANFMPKPDPLGSHSQHVPETETCNSGIAAEQLSSALRVDSYFAPKLLPLVRMSLQLTALELHVHNSMPFITSQVKSLDGYYVSKPLMRSHRALTLNANGTTIHTEMGSPAGALCLINTHLSNDILDCASGTMEPLVNKFNVAMAISFNRGTLENPRLRFCTSKVHVILHVPRVRTLHALAVDWKDAFKQFVSDETSLQIKFGSVDKMRSKQELVDDAMASLEGRVSLWLHNDCVCALRVGQEGTEEMLPLESGTSLAYRWRNPTAIRKLRFAFANPSSEWRWSSSIPFSPRSYCVRLEGIDCWGGTCDVQGSGVFLHIDVTQTGSVRCMRLSGRLLLANMLRFGLLYKVRFRFAESKTWRTVSSGELAAECIGRSIVCGSNCEMVLKIKNTNYKYGWSGDIPLKECPKENVPWLVKVPIDGDVPYISVWCRVVRTRIDGRILATIWPLYVLHSHLPLDTDVLIVTETNQSSVDVPAEEDASSPPLVQTAAGRGNSTHLLAPGTTIAKHSLSFQYRNIECPVTREAIPLHYGVTDTSVFDKSASVKNIDEVLHDVRVWLDRSCYRTETSWPYSVVTKHWPGIWQPALLQPRSDVTVRYQAVQAGGGCSLEIHLSPVVLLCNASPVALTLRAHDAAPLCKLGTGAAISPSTAMLTKPFFMSVEKGRETFVSGQLEVCTENPTRYKALATGQVAVGYPTTFAIQSNQKMAMFTMYYEIKDEINIIGVTTTYSLSNMLDTNILVSAIAVAGEEKQEVLLHPKTFKVLQPTKDRFHGIPLCRFWLRERWRGGDASLLHMFLCFALPAGASAYPASTPVPVRLSKPPARRALALIDVNKQSIAVVVTQQKREGRWYIAIARDPYPQFMVHNRTCYSLAITQPSVQSKDEASASYTTAVSDCAGARWWNVVEPDSVLHYSSPAHCMRYLSPPDAIQFLTFSRIKDDSEPDWCAPVAAVDGEMEVLLCRGLAIKIRVCMHPHSSLIELQNIDQKNLVKPLLSRKLERVGAEDKLLNRIQRRRYVQPAKESRNSSTHKFNSATSIATPVTNQDGDVTDEIPANKHLDSVSNKVNETHEDISMSIDSYTISVQDQLLNPYVKPSKDRLGLSTLQIYSATSSTTLKGTLFSKHDGYEANMETDMQELMRCTIASVTIVMSVTGYSSPVFALYLDQIAVAMSSHATKTKTTLSVTHVQIDNGQYDSNQFDFPVVATTGGESLTLGTVPWPPLWNMFAQQDFFSTNQIQCRILLNICHEKWTVIMWKFNELTEVDIRVGPLALYVEEAYVTALVELFRFTTHRTLKTHTEHNLSQTQSLHQRPLCLRTLHVHPLDVTVTLHAEHTIYIALDKSLLHLSSFTLHNMMTSAEHLTHELTVHYLSAAILGAGWIVGGLELLGAPGAFVARMLSATGGVKGIAAAAAASFVRSVSACAESLAHNLDVLACDEGRTKRARRRLPDTFIAGVAAGVTNIAVNVLGIVGGLPQNPLFGEGMGYTDSSAATLRRGLLGTLSKPLSATAALVAFAGHGLLKQTGWDPMPQPRQAPANSEYAPSGWRRNCVRWTFRLAEMTVLAGFEVLLNNAHLQLLITHKFIVVADPECERVVEMIDLRFCTLSPYQGTIIELHVSQRRISKVAESRALDEDDEYQMSAAAMTRLTSRGAEAAPEGVSHSRVLLLLPSPGQSCALHAALAAALHYNSDTHFALL